MKLRYITIGLFILIYISGTSIHSHYSLIIDSNSFTQFIPNNSLENNNFPPDNENMNQSFHNDKPEETPALLADVNDINLTGVRIYTYYPLSLDYDLCYKMESYSESIIGENFAQVMGFNQTKKVEFLDYLTNHPELLTESISENINQNSIHFQFGSNPEIDFFLLPFLLISTEEICNSTTWISRNVMVNSRSTFLSTSDNLVQDVFSLNDLVDPGFHRGFTDGVITTITSIENVTPSIHQHYIDNNAIVDDTFSGLCTHTSGYSIQSAFMIYPFLAYWPELMHLAVYSTHMAYHDLVLVSYLDHPNVHTHGIEPYQNPVFPLGQVTVFSSLIWQTDVLLRYAQEHIVTLSDEMLAESGKIDSIITSLESDQSNDALQSHLSTLSIDVKDDLAGFQNQIFDLQELLFYTGEVWHRFNASNYLIPFIYHIQELERAIELRLELLELRYPLLKSEYDSTLQIVSQLLADSNSLESIKQAWERLYIGTITTIGMGIVTLAIPLSLEYIRRRKEAKEFHSAKIIDAADTLASAFSLKELRMIAKQSAIETGKRLKLGIAISLVQEKGIEWALETLHSKSTI